jgi:hypothetical protein
MKLLCIRDSKGSYLTESGEYEPLEQIAKEDLLRLVDLTLTTDAEMDDYDASILQNQAHQIIYENLWSKLRDLATRKTEFLDESKRLFLTEYERYRSGANQQPEEEEGKDTVSDPAPVPTKV